jgi:hypothetical protein
MSYGEQMSFSFAGVLIFEDFIVTNGSYSIGAFLFD